MITFQGVEINTNQLFNFDHLKHIIELLCQENNSLKDRTEILEKQNEDKDKQLNSLDEKLSAMNSKWEKRLKAIELELAKNTKKTNIMTDKIEKEEENNHSKAVSEDIKKEHIYTKEQSFVIQSSENKNKTKVHLVTEKSKKEEKIIIDDDLQFNDMSQEENDKNNQYNQNNKETVNYILDTKENKSIKSNDNSKEYIVQKNKETKNDKEKDDSIIIQKKEEVPQESYNTIELKEKLDENINENKSNKEHRTISQSDIEKSQKNPLELISKLFKRVKDLETQMKQIDGKLSTETQTLKGNDTRISSKVKDLKENNEDHQSQLALLKQRYAELSDKAKKNEEIIEAMRVKVTDFNIYDIFKDAGHGNMDASKALIITLETKVFKKFSLLDGKMKEAESDIQKLKNDVINNANNITANSRNLIRQKDDLTVLNDTVKVNNDNIGLQLKEIRQTLESNYAELLELITRNKTYLTELIKQNIDALNDSIKNLEIINKEAFTDDKVNINNKDDQQGKLSGLSDEERRMIHNLKTRIVELETALRVKLASLDLYAITNDLKDLKKDVSSKISQVDLKELYSLHDTNAAVIEDLRTIIDSLINDNKKITSDSITLIRKIESLTGAVSLLQSLPRGNNDQKGPAIDISQYIDQSKFIESTQQLHKELDSLHKEDEDIRRTLNDLVSIVQNSASNDSLKSMQDYINQNINEYKLYVIKKYVEKNELNKLIKNIELEMKIIGEAGKRSDGDNWLIAKKPLYGYQCASCESQIANIANQNNDYVPWNKYPAREDKNYRMGSGFSHMLQMMNQEAMKNYDSKDFNSDNEEFDIKRIREKGGFNNQNRKLPKIRNQPVNLITEDIFNYSDEKAETFDNRRSLPINNSPKVVRIIKKNKPLKVDIQQLSINMSKR